MTTAAAALSASAAPLEPTGSFWNYRILVLVAMLVALGWYLWYKSRPSKAAAQRKVAAAQAAQTPVQDADPAAAAEAHHADEPPSGTAGDAAAAGRLKTA